MRSLLQELVLPVLAEIAGAPSAAPVADTRQPAAAGGGSDAVGGSSWAAAAAAVAAAAAPPSSPTSSTNTVVIALSALAIGMVLIALAHRLYYAEGSPCCRWGPLVVVDDGDSSQRQDSMASSASTLPPVIVVMPDDELRCAVSEGDTKTAECPSCKVCPRCSCKAAGRRCSPRAAAASRVYSWRGRAPRQQAAAARSDTGHLLLPGWWVLDFGGTQPPGAGGDAAQPPLQQAAPQARSSCTAAEACEHYDDSCSGV